MNEKLKGTHTTWAGVVTCGLGVVGLVVQLFSKGKFENTAGSIGLITTGIGLIKSADANQQKGEKDNGIERSSNSSTTNSNG